jgi:hypothetical protein
MSKIKSVTPPKVGLAKNKETINKLNPSDGYITAKDYPEPKTSGIKIRGTGAAVRGVTARGPMA